MDREAPAARFVENLHAALEGRVLDVAICWWPVAQRSDSCAALLQQLLRRAHARGEADRDLARIPAHAFVILDADALVEVVMPSLSKSSQLRSLFRQ